MANEFLQWLASLDREYVFLLALPFVVAAIGLWSWWVDQEDVDREYEVRAEGERRRRERRRGERRAARDSRLTA